MKKENEEIIASWRKFWDVPLELAIELGRTRMKIREILDLAPSSIVRLSRSTGEGVDVRVDDKSMLRGEIVVLEDRSAVRISEIIKEDI